MNLSRATSILRPRRDIKVWSRLIQMESNHGMTLWLLAEMFSAIWPRAQWKVSVFLIMIVLITRKRVVRDRRGLIVTLS